jgi:hypothetical protein
MLMVDVVERNGTDALLDGNPMGGGLNGYGIITILP